MTALDQHDIAGVEHFSQSYAEARQKFLAAARSADAALQAWPHPSLRGAQDEEIAIDVALLGDKDAANMLILSSATHGVEGFCGSGCQIDMLTDPALVARVKTGAASVLLLHAINPHGFSHLRRVNEDNVDLNRNFLDHSQLPDSQAYAGVHALLLPETWPPSAQNTAALFGYIGEHGMAAFQAAVSGGQYQFADGMFFGGFAPTWSNLTLRRILGEYCAGKQRIGWIDFHTGLGPRGHGEKIFAGLNDDGQIARAKEWWGREVTSVYDGSSSSSLLRGMLTAALTDAHPQTEYAGIALEFGVLPAMDTIMALRADHWLYNNPDAPAALREQIKRQLRATFYEDGDQWKGMILTQARRAILQGLARLES